MKRSTEAGAPTTLRRIFRVAAFGISSAAGFLVAEALIVLGLYVIFGKLQLPGDLSSSPALLALDVLALVVGVTVSFLLNERTTVGDVRAKNQGEKRDMLARLGWFQGVSALGNAVVILVQLALLAEFSLSPALGSIVGAMAGFPVSYLISMRLVWKVRV